MLLNLVRSNIRRSLGVRISPSWAGSQQLNFVSFELREAVFAPASAGAWCAGRSRTFETDEVAFEGCSDTRDKFERWRQDYNKVRPHGALSDRAPEEFASAWQTAAATTASSDGLREGGVELLEVSNCRKNRR
jgi:hypothetical protein